MGRPYDIRERARGFARDVYVLAQQVRSSQRPLTYFAEQALRAAASIGANLEEARDAQSKPDFISKNQIALKEARETSYWLRLMQDAEPAVSRATAPLATESSELIAILTTIVKTAKSNAAAQGELEKRQRAEGRRQKK